VLTLAQTQSPRRILHRAHAAAPGHLARSGRTRARAADIPGRPAPVPLTSAALPKTGGFGEIVRLVNGIA
jgi:hypothetical protein